MARGRTKKGRARASLAAALPSARVLLKGCDHGEGVVVHGHELGAAGEHWVEPFLAANMPHLRRLDLTFEVRADPHLRVVLRPGTRIGAVPLLNPSTRRVSAGLLIEPRFRWAALGAVFSAIGFTVEPGLGGAPLVPGSAREVPPWMLAGPVIGRIEAFLRHRRRAFVERSEVRASPRGQVEWNRWIVRQVPRGWWAAFPCRFSEPESDPEMDAAVRWTLLRLQEDLSTMAWSPPARYLLQRAAELQARVGPGRLRRPPSSWFLPGASEWAAEAVEAMSWVAEERGLGGARSLDGLAWDLSIEAVWESWVAAFAAKLSRRLGMTASPYGTAKRLLRWEGAAQSMGALVPDVELRAADRTVWLDAKYKAHLELLGRRGWEGLSEEVRAEHRADLHQALAYASLADVRRVDTVLIYPRIAREDRTTAAIATVTSGRRQVRLILASLPFGYRNPDHEDRCLCEFRELLAA